MRNYFYNLSLSHIPWALMFFSLFLILVGFFVVPEVNKNSGHCTDHELIAHNSK